MVSLTTIAEIYNEDDHTINHHGFERNVKDTGRENELKVDSRFTVHILLGVANK